MNKLIGNLAMRLCLTELAGYDRIGVNPGKVKVTAFFVDKPTTVHNRTSVSADVVIKAGRVTKGSLHATLPGERRKTYRVTWPAFALGQKGRTVSTSQLQEQTKERLRLLLSDYQFIENYRPDWLKNPESGYNLELDFWLPEANVGIEVQGRQHSEYTPHFHNDEDGFRAQVRRDVTKKALCEQCGVALYEIYTPDDIDAFIENMIACASEFEVLLEKNAALKTLGFYAAEIVRMPKKSKNHKEHQIKTVRRDALLRRMVNIAQQYQIPLNAIKPDFTIRKVELHFLGRPIVKVFLYDDEGEVVNSARAAIMYAKGDVARLNWYDRFRGKNRLVEVDFNLQTGQALESPDGFKWQINKDTLPDDLEVMPPVEVGQQVIWHGSDPDGKHDFDLPIQGTVVDTATKAAQIKVKTKSNTTYRRWVPALELEIVD